MADSKRVEYREGPDAAQRFESAMNRIVTVSKDELTKREAAYQKTKRPKPSKKR